MNNKIVVYSWTGNAAACAVALQNELGTEPFLLVEEKERAGSRGFAMGGLQASLGLKTKVKALPDISGADTLILGMPLWAGTTPPAINTFLKSCSVKEKNVYIFVTQMSADVPKKLEKKIRNIVTGQGGQYKHMFVVSVPKGAQISVEGAKSRAVKWAERINALE
ncbi:hypothetical protein LJC27_00255 [Christensenellaceae bacterium OttesenSCG-928-M15]|nr:hypothetical protein [Christensenellaceae bacterium OttesenSCG-928-M15]